MKVHLGQFSLVQSYSAMTRYSYSDAKLRRRAMIKREHFLHEQTANSECHEVWIDEGVELL